MARTPHTTLRDLIASELITYLGDGVINPSAVSQAITHNETEIDDLRRLKQLRFALHEPVVSYLEAVPEWLRRIKTDHRQQQEVVRGEIRGRIDWQETRQVRSRVGYDDPTLFAISSPAVEYDLPENRVVKKLLSVIVQAIERDIPSDHDSWGSELTRQASSRIVNTYRHNQYLEQLPAAADISISARDLDAARRSRHELYREGQRLFRLYDGLLNNRYHRPGVQELLRETLITPTATHRIFELVAVFGTVRRLQATYPEIQLQPIRPGMDELALLETDSMRLAVYHDQQGPLSFHETITDRTIDLEVLPEPFQRLLYARDAQRDALEAFLDQTDRSGIYSGRPDFLILQYDRSGRTTDLSHVTIGECKYTASRKTFATGLRELVEYMYYVREGEQYLFTPDDNGTTVEGIICTDGVETETATTESITHFTKADLESWLTAS